MASPEFAAEREVILASATTDRLFDRELRSRAKSPEEARLVMKMIYLCGTLISQAQAHKLKVSPKLSPDIFILSDGHQFFDKICSSGWNSDGVHGWCKVGGVTKFQGVGEHMDFSRNTENVRKLADVLTGRLAALTATPASLGKAQVGSSAASLMESRLLSPSECAEYRVPYGPRMKLATTKSGL
eukprot:2932155-Rhodomonas_salina.1